MYKKFFQYSICYCIINLFLFAIYRILFLHLFANQKNYLILLSGCRLDIALIFFEIFLIGMYQILRNKHSLRTIFTFFCTITFIHILYCTANLFYFQERYQHLNEGLMAYIASPYEIWIAVSPVLKNKWYLLLFLMLLIFFWIYLTIYFKNRIQQQDIKIWNFPCPLLPCLFLTALCLLPTIDPVIVKKSKSALGWKPRFAHSKYYTKYNNYIQNQAIPNPWYELFRVYIALSLQKQLPYKLDKQEAWTITKNILQLLHTDEKYPLLQTIQSPHTFNIENIVIVQIEGLTQSILEKQINDQFIMPFCHQLSREGIYFPNILQSYNATSGGFYSTATSIHKDPFQEKQKIFTNSEINCNFATLTKLLPSEEYTFYMATPFRQNINDFITFTTNQGFQSYTYNEFHNRLKEKDLLEKAEDMQGIFDEYFLQECAEILENTKTKYVMHLITVTSHSPWTTPDDFPNIFSTQAFNAYHYTDKSIEKFIKRLQQNKEQYNKTLFVYLADHVGYCLTEDFLERNRIPLIFHHPQLNNAYTHHQTVYGSQVDVLPTILYILGNTHQYS
ncbi:MAG TPA: LTA synthase family protein, partial [Planctomycetota bacterium]|nr:LTA synthase family protein [Planctomycetota bacterium]